MCIAANVLPLNYTGRYIDLKCLRKTNGTLRIIKTQYHETESSLESPVLSPLLVVGVEATPTKHFNQDHVTLLQHSINVGLRMLDPNIFRPFT